MQSGKVFRDQDVVGFRIAQSGVEVQSRHRSTDLVRLIKPLRVASYDEHDSLAERKRAITLGQGSFDGGESGLNLRAQVFLEEHVLTAADDGASARDEQVGSN